MDTAEQAHIKSEFTDSLREEHGDAWLEEFAGLLEHEWLFLLESHLTQSGPAQGFRATR